MRSTPSRAPIRTKRLLLEPIAASHERALTAAVVATRESLLPWMPWAGDFDEARHRDMLESSVRRWREGDAFHFAVRAGRDVIGVVGVDRVDRTSWEIHYWISGDRTGLGYATEAAAGVIGFARRELHAERIMLNAGIGNRRSLAVARKLGFVRDGPLPGGLQGADGMFPAYVHHLDLGDQSHSGVHEPGASPA